MTLLDRLRSALQRRDDVTAAWLYGSRARGTERPDSDVDVAVLRRRAPAAPSPLDELPLDLEAELEAELGLPVQVVDFDRAPADLAHRVLRDGHLLVDRDPALRIACEVSRRNEYWDLEPIRRAYRSRT